MKKTLSVFLSVLMLLSVFGVAAFAAEAPELKDLKCTYDGIEISWTADDNAVNYLVYRAEGIDGELVCVGTTTETKYLDKAVTKGVAYTYTVALLAADGSYTKPNIADGETIIYTEPFCLHKAFTWVVDSEPTIFASGSKHKECNTCHENLGTVAIAQLVTKTPAIKALCNRTAGVVLSWEVVDGATSYYVYKRGAGESWKLFKITTSTSLTDTTVESGKYYRYTIRAKNGGGLSPYDPGKVIKYVAAPTNIKASNTTGGIYVSWNAVAGATVYRVYRKNLGDAQWTYLGNTKKTNYADLDVTAATDYVYTVRAVSNGVYSYYYDNGADARRLENPELVSAVSSKEGVTVSWGSVEGAKGYYVYRKTAGTTWKLIGTVKNPRSTAYLDKSTSKGATYTYTVRAFAGTTRSWYNTTGISCKDVH